MPPKRAVLSNLQRLALREKHRTEPHLRQAALIAWFEEQFSHKIPQSTLSDTLSRRFEHLDNSTRPRHLEARKRARDPHWPELEKALYEVVLRLQASVPITEDFLRAKAEVLWSRLDSYAGMQVPTFSNGWIDGFKRRHNIRRRIRHGEANAVDLADEDVSRQLHAIRSLVSQYQPSNVYNCDETSLFWKMMPSRGLSTQQLAGSKLDKSRISLHFCCNSDGSDKLPLLAIGKHARPRSFRRQGVNINRLNLIWRHNGKAWMTTSIFLDWLRWFNNHVAPRHVLLLMDNFSAHASALEQLEAEEALPYVTVAYLPANTTSKTQPLDQGIINTFKSKYRTSWLRFAVQEFEKVPESNPLRTHTLLQALVWSIRAWEDIATSTVINCWRKANLACSVDTAEINELDDHEQNSNLHSLMQHPQIRSRIADLMSIEYFLNPIEEQLQESSVDDVVDDIIEQLQEPDQEDNEDGIELPVSRISAVQALQYLSAIRLHELQQDDREVSLISSIHALERHLEARQQRQLVQSSIPHFFHAM